METLTKNPRGPSDPTAAAPRWVMLNRNNAMDSGGSSAAADARTTAASCTSSGLPLAVSVSIAAPPERSSFHYDLLPGGSSTPSSDDKDTKKDLHLQIIAAHDDSVLIESRVPQPGFGSRVTFEYFLYEAGAGRTPSLSLLPGCYVSNQFERENDARQVPTRIDEARNLSFLNNTGILRRGEGEVLVAQLEVGYDAPYRTAELCVLRPGLDLDWVLRQVPIVHHDGEGELQHWTEIDAALPVGGRFMCWVDYLSGFLLCDMAMAEENAKLRYVPLPVPPPKTRHRHSERPYMQYCQKLADAGRGALRFVSIAPRCCCGGPGKTTCERSSFAFNVTTWTMTLRTEEPMVWVRDIVLDCDELWQLPNYGRLPRVPPRYPIVSSDDPDIVCLTVCENHYFIDNADETEWIVEINTRSKTVLSVVPSDTKYYVADFLPAKLHW